MSLRLNLVDVTELCQSLGTFADRQRAGGGGDPRFPPREDALEGCPRPKETIDLAFLSYVFEDD